MPTWREGEAKFLDHQTPDARKKNRWVLHAEELKPSPSNVEKQTKNQNTKAGDLKQGFEFVHSWTKHSSETQSCLLIQHLDGEYSGSGPLGVIPQNSLFFTLTNSAYNFPWAKFLLLGRPARCALSVSHRLCRHQTVHVLFGTQPWNIFRIIRMKACSQEHQKYYMESNLSSTRLSGTRGTSIVRHKILVSWENPPQGHKHNKNKGNVSLLCVSQHNACFFFIMFSTSARTPCQFLPLHSWLWNSTVSLYYCKQR